MSFFQQHILYYNLQYVAGRNAFCLFNNLISRPILLVLGVCCLGRLHHTPLPHYAVEPHAILKDECKRGPQN